MAAQLLEKNIFLGLKETSKEDAIKLAGRKLVEAGCVEEAYINAMLEREKVMTTYMGMGLAIPHGVNEAKKDIIESGIVILQYPDGVSFDGEMAYLVVGIAGKGDEHLEILSSIAIALDDDVVEKLRVTTSKSDFIEAFAE
ncbi:PTS mannose transporter subunit IIA [Peptostreptococcus sp. MV1]|uniref:PTS sugar transporter subunit IIA n=1 Tax=Peptostreptococcus sp. MV1 TaxID=1219626 RepID=UPI00050F4727|nr:PTS sugar transporter subunit IIA [Peptostreptococcus sp. MV1]KGF14401.1 PTS mannose transporter subunit IIA [Peptostreptococcus sp. MV1]